MTEEEQRAFERFDKPEWAACGNLRLRVLLSVCHETITRLGGKIENLQDSLAAADRRIADREKDAAQQCSDVLQGICDFCEEPGLLTALPGSRTMAGFAACEKCIAKQ